MRFPPYLHLLKIVLLKDLMYVYVSVPFPSRSVSFSLRVPKSPSRPFVCEFTGTRRLKRGFHRMARPVGSC